MVPKMAPRGSKIAPQWLEMSLRWSQDSPTKVRGRFGWISKNQPRRPHSPRMPKLAPRCSHEAPKWPKMSKRVPRGKSGCHAEIFKFKNDPQNGPTRPQETDDIKYPRKLGMKSGGESSAKSVAKSGVKNGVKSGVKQIQATFGATSPHEYIKCNYKSRGKIHAKSTPPISSGGFFRAQNSTPNPRQIYANSMPNPRRPNQLETAPR